MLRLVRHVGAAILEFGYARFLIRGQLPILVGSRFSLALAVKGYKLVLGRCVDAALLGQAQKHLLITLARIPPHNAFHGRIGFHV